MNIRRFYGIKPYKCVCENKVFNFYRLVTMMIVIIILNRCFFFNNITYIWYSSWHNFIKYFWTDIIFNKTWRDIICFFVGYQLIYYETCLSLILKDIATNFWLVLHRNTLISKFKLNVFSKTTQKHIKRLK